VRRCRTQEELAAARAVRADLAGVDLLPTRDVYAEAVHALLGALARRRERSPV
jgi:hypothetical protein